MSPWKDRRMGDSERRKRDKQRRRDAYKQPVETVLARIKGEDDDLFNLLDAASNEDPLASGYLLTNLAALAVEELALIKGEQPADVLEHLLEANEPF